ncbi:MAG TPA: hypothetical protein EYP09_09525 [Anaerolineae bacterium]|nr:hypothetical protein [Anaerolineae bacterium]
MPALLSPPLVLSLVIASAYAAVFNLWQGGRAKKLPLHLVASWLGFGIGELAGDLLGLDVAMIGQIHVLEGSLGSWLLMFLAKWLKM